MFIKSGYKGCPNGDSSKYAHPKICRSSLLSHRCDRVKCYFYHATGTVRPNLNQDLIIIINNNCLKSNIQCIEIRVQWTVHLGSSHMHVHAVTRVHAVTPKLVICVMYLTSI